ncbi:MAG TPA: hypothetical protein VGL42_16040 [Opitutaceae bacterium]
MTWFIAAGLLPAAAVLATDPAAEAARLNRLGAATLHSNSPTALRDALAVFQQAVDLQPQNASYWGDLGGAALLVAQRDRSYFMAVRGRDDLEKAVLLNPADLDAREGLMQFYGIAPWPLGDEDRARSEAAEIGNRNASRGARAECSLGKIFEKKQENSLALSAYRAALRFDPKSERASQAIKRLAPAP